MGMNEEEYLEKAYAEFEDYNNLLVHRNELLNQLQAYKDKEDKLREWLLSVIKEHETGQYDVSTVGLAIKEHKGNIEIILQILNEGSE
jgi:tRNA C32,U32 (ribose-2'-O)-methylase TrmJ